MKRTITYATLFVAIAAGGATANRSLDDDFPIYDNDGHADLVVDYKRFENQMEIVDRVFDPVRDRCNFEEGTIGGYGVRRLLRFDTVIMNMGDGDLVVGERDDPDNPYAALFYFADCHGHYHIRDFSAYELLGPNGQVVVSGHKMGCFEDSFKYAGNKSAGFDCHNNGITSGWGDWYYKQLPGQWIDITGVPAGDYIVQVRINLRPSGTGIFPEGENRYSNVTQTTIHIPDPRNKVTRVTN